MYRSEDFRCPLCGSEAVIEEIAEGAVVVLRVAWIDGNAVGYDSEPELYDYERIRYVCSEHGETLAETPEELSLLLGGSEHGLVRGPSESV